MKKLLAFTFFISVFTLYAQEDMDASSEETSEADQKETPYNQWSIDVGAGVHKAERPFVPGAYTTTPSFFQADLGIRYMFNTKFGLNLDLGYNSFQAADESIDFESTYYRTSLEGVLNFGSLVGMREWTDRFNILVHGGGGVSILQPDDPAGSEDSDYIMNWTVGLTPQLRLSDRIAFFGDLSIVGHVRQDYTFDGYSAYPEGIRGFNGFLVNASLGVAFYLGSNDVHADWYRDDLQSQIDELEDRVAKIETDNADDDQDGVPNYLDRDNTTEAGVAVDRKGRAIDTNKNGIPDEMESSLDRRYTSKEDVQQMVSEKTATRGSGNAIYELIDKGYVNVYFKFNSTQPATYSLEAINYLITYMNENPEAQAELIGYADEIGSESYNQELSMRRANMVKDILVSSGVDASRLTVTGNGEDTSVEKSSEPARQLVRRVTFKLK